MAGKAAEMGSQKHLTLWTVGGPHAIDPRSPLHPSLGQSAETLQAKNSAHGYI